MTAPLTDQQLAEIRAELGPADWPSEIIRLSAALADEKASHAKTIDNFNGYAEDTADTQKALNARLDVVRNAARVIKGERDRLRAELEQAREAGEPLRAAHFREAARLLEAVDCDDDAVNLLDNVAAGIEQQYNAHPACTCGARPVHQTGCDADQGN